MTPASGGTNNPSVAVIGAGGWGTALAMLLAGKGVKVSLWCFAASEAEAIRRTRENKPCLPGVRIPDGVEIVTDFKPILEARMVVLATPSSFMRKTLEAAKPFFRPGQVLVSVTKGVEQGSLLRMSEVIEEVLFPAGSGFRCSVATLSGPSHAEEVSRQMPTTVVAAAKDKDVSLEVQALFNTPWFRVYTSQDVIGVELGGSLKNVIALAAGIADGLGLGDNSKAALMTRGLAEITRLATALGARPATLAGLAGMGDLVVTCMSRHSRNRSVGERLGKGETWKEIQAGMAQVAEGVPTAVSAKGLSEKAGVELPICLEAYRVLFEAKAPRKALEDLMNRSLKPEEV